MTVTGPGTLDLLKAERDKGRASAVTQQLTPSDPNEPTLLPAEHPDATLKRIHAGIA